MVNERTGELQSSADTGELHTEPSAQNEVEQRGFNLGKSLRDPRTIVSFGLAIAIILFVFRGFNIDLSATWAYMRGADMLLLLTGLLVFYCTFPLRAVRWRMLLNNAGVPVEQGRKSWASLPALIEYIYLSWFANCIVPAKLGDAYRGYLLKHNGKVSFSSTFGTIFAERLLDMLGLFTFLVISGWFVFGTQLPPATNIIFISGLVLVAIIVSGLAGMRWFSPIVRRFMPQRVLRYYSSFEHAALRSFQPRILPRLFLLTGCVWLLEGFRLFFVIQALGVEGLHLALPVIIFVALASSLLTAVPLTPAGLGVVEGTITAVLLLFLPAATLSEATSSQNLALAVTFLDRAINFWSIVVFGFILYLVSKRK
ncbi:MAG TPA: lysylphosphatidylglycerol synthase transmembrane domain-containing protein [Roseiflexaceae bacterium]|nr:lysylphosphatidylglycerol synthase transmembrane domain-containing protein [Roseiflexaceae bacterium]HMP39463.1 lysylphosphatidylglycerol synthase transmembrane domain-containing protein [Roseiflexaceae bacterium]